MTVLDHLVYAVPDLEAGVAAFTRLTGVAPVKGGAHPGGTANYLVGLGSGAYLEIIGPDPEQDERPRAFGLETLAEPRLAGWAVRTTEIDDLVARARAAGYDPGEVSPLSRRKPDGTLLEWRLTRIDNPEAVRLAPFVIDWGATTHPSEGLPQLELVALSGTHPEPAKIEAALHALGAKLDVAAGEPALEAALHTPNGLVTLR
ncbi:VOC family protein [Nonomuraea sp. NPDC050310]|uniref:VOC family protein n=1 Tax=unclassified Nonomuraea TaxID=2593643 RepID=UPI0033F38B5E